MNARGKIHQHVQASQDLIELFAYLSDRNETAARLFLKEVRKAYELILEVPGIDRRWESSSANIRELRVTSVSHRFHDYLIVYRKVTGGIQILTILHGARDVGPLIDSLPDDWPIPDQNAE